MALTQHLRSHFQPSLVTCVLKYLMTVVFFIHQCIGGITTIGYNLLQFVRYTVSNFYDKKSFLRCISRQIQYIYGYCCFLHDVFTGCLAKPCDHHTVWWFGTLLQWQIKPLKTYLPEQVSQQTAERPDLIAFIAISNRLLGDQIN